MFYNTFYQLFADLVGETAMATAQGQIFAQYGAYIFIIIAIVMVFGICDKILNFFKKSL